MERLSKCKKVFKEYFNSILIGSAVILCMIAVAVSIQHFLTLFSIMVLLGVVIYLVNKE